jgi:lipoteichoic acid synthase
VPARRPPSRPVGATSSLVSFSSDTALRAKSPLEICGEVSALYIMQAHKQHPVADPRCSVLQFSFAAATFAVVLVGPRAWILHQLQFTPWPGKNPAVAVLKLAIAASDDAGLTAGLAAAFLLLLIMFQKRPSTIRVIYRSFVVLASICLLISILNIRVVVMLGRPLSYQWLYYSDFLRSMDAHEAILAGLRGWLPAASIIVPTCYVLVNLLFGERAARRAGELGIGHWKVALTLVSALVMWSAAGARAAQSRRWPAAKIANPVSEFARSWAQASRQPALFTMQAPAFEPDPLPPGDEVRAISEDAQAIRNVILFVIESTPAEYLGVYGSKLGVTPHLDYWAGRAAVFDNIYAHAPATNKSMFSVLCSKYPWISYKSETEEKPDI